MKKEYSILLRAMTSLGVAIAGCIYLNSTYAPKNYNPHVMETSDYTIIDADRDGDVDVIDPKKGGLTLIAPDMKEWIQKNGDNFFDMYGYSTQLTKELQDSATRTLHGQQEISQLERQIEEFDKK